MMYAVRWARKQEENVRAMYKTLTWQAAIFTGTQQEQEQGCDLCIRLSSLNLRDDLTRMPSAFNVNAASLPT